LPVAFQVDVAEAVLAELKLGSWSQSFQPERLYYAAFTPDELRQLRVTVIPLTYTQTRLSRSQSEYTEGVMIDVQKFVEPQDKKQVDDLIYFVDELVRYFADGHRLTGSADRYYDTATLVDDRLWSPEMLYTESTFETALEVAIGGTR
jgi:uncharacterized protein YtpQ (UPF0354 family)